MEVEDATRAKWLQSPLVRIPASRYLPMFPVPAGATGCTRMSKVKHTREKNPATWLDPSWPRFDIVSCCIVLRIGTGVMSDVLPLPWGMVH